MDLNDVPASSPSPRSHHRQQQHVSGAAAAGLGLGLGIRGNDDDDAVLAAAITSPEEEESEPESVTGTTMEDQRQYGQGVKRKRSPVSSRQQQQQQGQNQNQNQSQGQGQSQGQNNAPPQTISCEICKQRKVKCDRGRPSCGWCAKNGQLCEYKERKKPGLRAGYGKELESRLDRLEDIIQLQGRLIESHIFTPQQPQPQPQVHTRSRSQTQTTSPPGHTPSASIDKPTDSTPVGGETSLPLMTPTESARTVSAGFQQPLLDGPSMPLVPVSQLLSQNIYQSNQPTPLTPFKGPSPLYTPLSTGDVLSDADLPPSDMLYNIVDLYFEHISTWCPILHRQSIFDTFFGGSLSALEEDDRILLYAIIASTLRFCTDPRLGSASTRQRFYENAKQKVLLRGLETSSVKSLQALVILALDFIGTYNGPPAWKLLAVICRSIVQIGLSVEATSDLAANWHPSIYTLRSNILPQPKSWIEDESRRRLFWEVYILDRYAMMTTAFDFALDDKDIDRKLPCREEFFTKNEIVETPHFVNRERTDGNYGDLNAREKIGSWGFYVEVIGLLSRVHSFLKRPVDIGSLADVEEWQETYRKLDSELRLWETHLPVEYAFDNASRLFMSKSNNKTVATCGWVMLHATYQTTIIRLHSAAAYPTTRSSIFTPSYSAIQRCLLAVQSIHTLTTYVVTHGMLDKVGPTFAFTLWVCARLLLVHGSTIARTLSPEIYFFVDTLHKMGSAWKVAESYSSILQRILDEYREQEGVVALSEQPQQQQQGAASARGGEAVAATAATAGMGMQEEQPATVRMLADMRRCAFDLDFMISRQGAGGMGMGGYYGTAPGPPAPPATVGMSGTGGGGAGQVAEGGAPGASAIIKNDGSSSASVAAAAAAAAASGANVDTESTVPGTTAIGTSTQEAPSQQQDHSQATPLPSSSVPPAAGPAASSALLPLPTATPYRSGGTAGLQDFEYLDVFGFFNYPRLPQSQWAMPAVSGVQQQQQQPQQQPQPQPQLNPQTQAQAQAQAQAEAQAQVQAQAQPWIPAQQTQQPAQPQPQSFEQANYNITNYLVPTPESDWLFPAGA